MTAKLIRGESIQKNERGLIFKLWKYEQRHTKNLVPLLSVSNMSNINEIGRSTGLALF